MKYTHLTLVLLIIICSCKPSQKIAKKEHNKQDFINHLFQDYIGEKPSASFIVIKDNEIKACQSFGYADLENKVLATCETNYRLASVTKQYTAMAILILIQKGKLSYETKLTEVIPEFPDYGKDITIKSLLTHRSGLKEYYNLYPKEQKEQLSDEDVLYLLKEQDSLLFPANSKSKYSNSGYALLSLIVERTSNKSFKQFMDDEIFKKIGMLNSTIYEKDLEIKNRAFGYEFKKSLFNRKDQDITSAIKGDGGVYSSVKDFYSWNKALTNNSLIPPNLKKDAFSNWSENEMILKKDYGFGFGWLISYINNQKYIWHSGVSVGFRTMVLRIPSEKIAIAIYTNSNYNSSRLLTRKAIALASLYSGYKLPMPVEITLEKEINVNGSKNIKEFYNKLIANQQQYEIDKKDLISLGFKYLRKKENENCLNIFTLAKTQFPNYYKGYFGLAQYHKTNESNIKAVENFKKALELAPNDNKRFINYSKKMIKKLEE